MEASFAEYSRLIVQFISLKRKIFSWLLIVEWVNWIVWLTWKVSELYSFGAVKSYLQPLNGLSAGLIKIPPFTIYQGFCVTNFPYIVALKFMLLDQDTNLCALTCFIFLMTLTWLFLIFYCGHCLLEAICSLKILLIKLMQTWNIHVCVVGSFKKHSLWPWPHVQTMDLKAQCGILLCILEEW